MDQGGPLKDTQMLASTFNIGLRALECRPLFSDPCYVSFAAVPAARVGQHLSCVENRQQYFVLASLRCINVGMSNVPFFVMLL